MRKAHPAFRMTAREVVTANVRTETAGGGGINRIDGAAVGDLWSEIVVVYASGANREIPLPEGGWMVALERLDSEIGNDRFVSGRVYVQGTAVGALDAIATTVGA